MNVKKAFIIMLITLILFASISAISADDDKYYTIDHADISLTVKENGLLHVYESYDYSFHGTYNGVYRDIPLKNGERIENIKVSATGAYTVLEEINKNGEKELKIYLYADSAHTKKISDKYVKIYISYDMINTVRLYNDVGALQYKLWGDEWDVAVESINAKIYLPSDSGIKYYLNPKEFNKTSSLNGHTIKVTSYEIPSGDFYELLVMMPAGDFDKDAVYAKKIHENGEDKIMKNLNDSIQNREFLNTSYLFLGLLSLLEPLATIIIYFRYGREPKVDYGGIYERELPTSDPPEVVNALIDNKEEIGTPNMKGFEASILNLIDRKIIHLQTKENKDTETKDLYLEFDSSKDNELSLSEKSLISTLFSFAQNNVLNLSSLNSQLSSEYNAKRFMSDYNSWQDNVKKEYLNDSQLTYYFNSKGAKVMKKISVGGLVIGIIIFLTGMFATLKSGFYAMIGGAFLAILSFIILQFVPDDIFGQWSENGRVIYLKWNNFKKFLKDNSLINEHPPESIVVWRKYLIYGAALGVADNVYNSMKLHEHNYDNDYDDDIFRYHHYGGYYMMHNAFQTGESAANPSSDSGSFGSIGGGSGGGGGGAF